MKTSDFKIYRLIAGIVLLLISVAGYSQDTKLTKEEKKALKKELAYHNFQVLDTMIENRNFVLEADYLEGKSGVRQPVSSLLNFIRVEAPNAVLQTGSDMSQGLNNVGGVTAEGSIQSFKITKNTKNLSIFVRFNVMTQLGVYDVAMSISSDKNARAEISGMGRGKLIYRGRVMNSWESRVYKGRNTI